MLELCDQLPRLMDYLVEHISYTIISSSQKPSSAPTYSSSTGLNLWASRYCGPEQGRPTWKEKEAITRMNTIQAWIFNRVNRSDSNEGKHGRLRKVEG